MIRPLLASAFFLASSATALAVPAPSLSCHSTGVADAGFTLRLGPGMGSGVLLEETFAGERPLAHLGCQRLNPVPRPDIPRNFLLCRGFAPRLGALAIRVYTPGFIRNAEETASVRQVIRVGGRLLERELRFGHLSCGH
jgi:hypothetical protein